MRRKRERGRRKEKRITKSRGRKGEEKGVRVGGRQKKGRRERG